MGSEMCIRDSYYTRAGSSHRLRDFRCPECSSFRFPYLLRNYHPYCRDIYRLGTSGRIPGTDRELDFCRMPGGLLSRHNNKCRQLDTVCPAKETGRYTPSNHDIRCRHRIVLVRVHGSHFRSALAIHIHFMCQYLQKRIS